MLNTNTSFGMGQFPESHREGPKILDADRSTEIGREITSPTILFSEAARLYESGYLSRSSQLSKPTRDKEHFYLNQRILPRWGSCRVSEIYPQAIEEWLHATFRSWWTKHGVRGMMNRMFRYAQGHGLWDSDLNPAAKAKLGKRRYIYDRRILSFEETARLLVYLEEPNRLIIETCIATGARISEVLALKWTHIDFESSSIYIEQRLWHQELDRTKTEGSRRTRRPPRYREKAVSDGATPESFIFQQKRARGKPLWDSGIRDALHQAAKQVGCDFSGLGPHSFRRANITWRQQVGGSAIEACRIAGHTDLSMTGEYTFVDPIRQNELTKRIQRRLAAGSQVSTLQEDSAGVGTSITADDIERPTVFTIPQVYRPVKTRSKVTPGSKASMILALIERPQGATSTELQEISGWAAHSIRGFMSGVVGKRLGRQIESTKEENGDRRYQISGA